MTHDALRKMIAAHPHRGSLPVECVLAVCMVESSCREWAIKAEPQYKWLYGDQSKMTIAEKWGQKHSWGLMQTMGAVVREYGFTGPFTDLWDPIIGLQYGMKHLSRLFAKYGNWPDTFASYNAGRPIKVDGKYVNQDYVDKCLRYWNDCEHQVPLKESEV